jgi:hypothetical protein
MSRRTKISAGAITEDTLEDKDGDTIVTVEQNADEDKIRFSTAGIERMVIDETGNVGIGINTPGAHLSIDGIQPKIKFTENGQNRAEIYINDSDNLKIINRASNKHMVFEISDGGTLREGLRLRAISSVQGVSTPEVVINDGSTSLMNFRVESDNNTHMIFVDGANDGVGIGNASPGDALDVTGNVRVSNYLRLNCQNTVDPTGSPPLINHAHIYSKLTGGTAEVFVQDSDGNVTQISPHNPEGEWHYFSRNTRTGKVVRVNMEKMIRRLEEITGESFMEEWYEDPTS